jgi:hypothetical protein
MSFTRFHDDPCRIKKQLQESTGPGRYALNTPGSGSNPDYFADPFIRMQKWGGNLRTNTVNLESDLKGLTRTLTKEDCLDYKKYEVSSRELNYPKNNTMTSQSRATNPAWLYKDLEQANWSILPLDPQENVCIPFQNNLSTRILEKDYYVPDYPCTWKTDHTPMNTTAFNYYGNGKDVNNCMKTNSCLNVD